MSAMAAEQCWQPPSDPGPRHQPPSGLIPR
jgi:hypothetical protein